MPDATMQPLSADPQLAADQAAQATSDLTGDAVRTVSDLAPSDAGGASQSAASAGSSPSMPEGSATVADSLPTDPGSMDPSAVQAPAVDSAGASSAPDPGSLASGGTDPGAAASHVMQSTGVDPSVAHATPPDASAMDPSLLHPGMVDSGHSLLSTTLVTAAYLCLILGVIFLAVWLLRRFGPAGIAKPKGSENPRLLGRLMLGAKQSVCVVRFKGRDLVLGVTEQRVNLLTECSAPQGCDNDEDEDDFTRFAEELAVKRAQARSSASDASGPADAAKASSTEDEPYLLPELDAVDPDTDGGAK